jgi:hypothetical protein
VGERTGAEYRARVRLSNKADETLADVGEACTRVPVASLAWLLASHKIEPLGAAMTDLGRADDDPEPAA